MLHLVRGLISFLDGAYNLFILLCVVDPKIKNGLLEEICSWVDTDRSIIQLS
jgi:hypothetical protein